MDKASRGLKILDMLQEKGSVNVVELSELFDTSEMTIRRDLNVLTKKYNIVRTHGGASMPQNGAPIIKTETFVEEKILHKEKKEIIAQKAAEYIEYRHRVFIDPGSTARLVTKYLKNENKNIIVTNSMCVAEACMEYDAMSVIMLGGQILPGSRCTIGDLAEEQLKSYRLDSAFVGAAAIGIDGKVYDGYSPEAWYKKMIFDVVEKVYLLVDSTKFNNYDLSAYAKLNQFEAVITDCGVDKKTIEFFENNNMKLIIAKPNK